MKTNDNANKKNRTTWDQHDQKQLLKMEDLVVFVASIENRFFSFFDLSVFSTNTFGISFPFFPEK